MTLLKYKCHLHSLTMRVSTLTFFFIFSLLPQLTVADCIISTAHNQRIPQDALTRTLQQHCAANVLSLRKQLLEAKLTLTTTVVANEGIHNQHRGSFSLFEIVSSDQIKPGDFFFGHFTTIDATGTLTLAQTPFKNTLMIEAMVWDHSLGAYNFYELRGNETGNAGQWYYRGNSFDILNDNTHLHLQPNPQNPQFGKRLRCSACHSLGGPIIKELDSPHNDWWETNRQLDFTSFSSIAAPLQAILNNLAPANSLSIAVKQGLRQLFTHEKFQYQLKQHTLREQIRPLFCPVELNLLSDVQPLTNVTHTIRIPLDFFIDPRLTQDTMHYTLNKKDYLTILENFHSTFPETDKSKHIIDADHAWLTPVKATSDQLLIATLNLDSEFMLNVLSIDMTNPIFSEQRCRLLKYIPLQYTSDWQAIFINNLKQANDPTAQILYRKLTAPPEVNKRSRDTEVRNYLQACQAKLKNLPDITQFYRLLLQRREEIKQSEISKNPLGQILEPGFRIIFPVTSSPRYSKVHTKVSLD